MTSKLSNTAYSLSLRVNPRRSARFFLDETWLSVIMYREWFRSDVRFYPHKFALFNLEETWLSVIIYREWFRSDMRFYPHKFALFNLDETRFSVIARSDLRRSNPHFITTQLSHKGRLLRRTETVLLAVTSLQFLRRSDLRRSNLPRAHYVYKHSLTDLVSNYVERPRMIDRAHSQRISERFCQATCTVLVRASWSI